MSLEYKVLGQDSLGVTNIREVAVINNNGNEISITTDGITFSDAITIGFPFQAIGYGNNIWTAIGPNSNSAYSTDGITWTLGTVPAYSTLSSGKEITYANDKFILGDVRVSLYSTDGISWNSSSPIPAQYRPASWAASTSLIVGMGAGGVVYSTDGISWSETSVSGAEPWPVVSNGQGFVSVKPFNNEVHSSTDGITWTLTSGLTDYFGTGLAYGQGRYVATTQGSNIVSSTDGITWTDYDTGIWGLSAVVYGSSGFIALDDSGTYAASTDGSTWTNGTLTVAGAGQIFTETLVYDGSNFVALDNNFQIAYYSTDGITWSQGGSVLSYEQILFAADGNVFAPRSGLYSTDSGATWQSYASIYNNGLLKFNNDYFQFGRSLFAKSTVLDSFTSYGVEDNRGVTYFNNQYLYIHNNHRVLTSSDGIVWTADASSSLSRPTSSGRYPSIAIGNNTIFVAREGEPIAYSTDAVTWNEIAETDIDYSTNGNSLLYKDGVFVGAFSNIDQNLVALSSTDGASWTTTTVAEIDAYLPVLAYANNKFIAVSANPAYQSISISTDGVSWEAGNVDGITSWTINSAEGSMAVSGDGAGLSSAISYTVPAGKTAVISSIFISNNDSVARQYSIAVVPDGETESDVHYLRKFVDIAANDFHLISTKITMSEGDSLRIFSKHDTVSANVFGAEL